jgi:hypothetical protein
MNPEPSKEALARAVRVGQRLQKIARMIERELEKAGADRDHVQFSLLVWGEGRTQYVGNAERSGVATAMREVLTRWETGDKDLGVPRLPLGGLDKVDG